ncbi:hypothetical protein [Kutzneria kofuensis]|uniref:Alanine-rich protein n=1 Tax=Kutzneria kofuensis TaxID=103725 RepID=A0A7W9KL23_9PSEU|nr:hypothetical protein [Kutzneria kofuensis]MBB5894524.1 hypothetical protein [Kutzneria kofuensis]
MVTTLAHAYSWDLVGDDAAADRFAGLGVGAVALAASYHTTRAATPLHPEHRMVDARHAALYVPVRPEAWRGKRLAPAEPSWMDSGSFGVAAERLRAVGLPVYAWTVLTHSSRLGDLVPDVTVRNAFGDRYPYALCPAQQDVVEYCETLVAEIVQSGPLDGVVLEACGPLGFVHGGHHEKTDGTDWSPVQQQLLSLCFCAACVALYGDAGIDVEQLRSAVRAGVDGKADSVRAALGEQLADAVSGVRTGLSRGLRQLLVGRIRESLPSAKIIAHAAADEWATGPFATVAGGVDADVDTLTFTAWPGPDAALPVLKALQGITDKALAAYVLALPPRPVDGAALAAEWRQYLDAGASELHVYHPGLASQGRLDAIKDALSRL